MRRTCKDTSLAGLTSHGLRDVVRTVLTVDYPGNMRTSSMILLPTMLVMVLIHVSVTEAGPQYRGYAARPFRGYAARPQSRSSSLSLSTKDEPDDYNSYSDESPEMVESDESNERGVHKSRCNCPKCKCRS